MDIRRHIILLTRVGKAFRQMLEDGRLSPGQHADYLHMRRLVRLYWSSTLDKLRDALAQIPPLGRDIRVRKAFKGMIQLWEELGNSVAITRAESLAIDSGVDASEVLQGCFYEKCPCFGRKPLHKPRYVCKGCWTTIYCGKRCQKRRVSRHILCVRL